MKLASLSVTEGQPDERPGDEAREPQRGNHRNAHRPRGDDRAPRVQARRHLQLGLREGAPGPARPLQEGAAQPVAAGRDTAVVGVGRPVEAALPRGALPALRQRHLQEAERQREGASRRRDVQLDPLAVPARRAGRAARRRAARELRARHGLEVLRVDAGLRRGAPRRGLRPLPAREDRLLLPDLARTSRSCSTSSSPTRAGT